MAGDTLFATVSAKFASGERVTAVLDEAVLIGPDWLQKDRILALVCSHDDYALFVLLSMNTPPKSFSDLSIERVLPIDANFKCEFGNASTNSETLLYVTISWKKVKLPFELKLGKTTAEFIDELYRGIGSAAKYSEPRPFNWLHKYSGSKKSIDFTSSTEMESPDIVVSRQNIAQGISQIAARDSIIKYQMQMKKDDYTDAHTFTVFTGTWNVNGQSPTTSLKPWLSTHLSPPDIYAVGFQELDLSKEALFFDTSVREIEWYDAVVAGLDSRVQYQKVELVRLVGMMLIIFVQKQYYNHVKNVAFDTVGTGIMGKLGNKGGVSVRFELHNTSFCFVNSHLAAHVEEFERRNQDYHDIYSRTQFTRVYPMKMIKDHDQIFWIGDLNYRITDMSHVTVKNLLQNNNIEAVLTADQLKIQHSANNVLHGFTEGIITFQPTYKYDPGTDNWDSSEKVRAPAWCDRIFWKGEDINQLSYESHSILNISDHKPVSAVFTSQVKVIDIKKYRKVQEDVIKKLDKLENEFLPHVTVEPTEIVFNGVKYLETQTQEICIANTGQVPVRFEFIKKLEESSFCKEWLNIDPHVKLIHPGEKCDVKFEVFVNKRSAYKLNSGEDKLYDILVLHLEGGKDIFITVNGSYDKSCFGAAFETLVHLNVPIHEINVKRSTDTDISKQDKSYYVPKEMFFLIDYIYKNGMKEPNLFKQPGRHSELLIIRDWLDSGSKTDICSSISSITEALFLLLESTAEPIVPYNHHYACLNAANNYLLCKQIIYQLPEPRRFVFLYICSFLREVLNYSSENGTDSKTLASLFGAIFLRDPPQNKSKPVYDRKKTAFIHHFLVNDHNYLLLRG